MKTVKLEINESIYDELMSFISRFDSKDIKITNYDSQTKLYLQSKLEQLESGKEKLYDIEQLEELLEETITKYENKAN